MQHLPHFRFPVDTFLRDTYRRLAAEATPEQQRFELDVMGETLALFEQFDMLNGLIETGDLWLYQVNPLAQGYSLAYWLTGHGDEELQQLLQGEPDQVYVYTDLGDLVDAILADLYPEPDYEPSDY